MSFTASNFGFEAILVVEESSGVNGLCWVDSEVGRCLCRKDLLEELGESEDVIYSCHVHCAVPW